MSHKSFCCVCVMLVTLTNLVYIWVHFQILYNTSLLKTIWSPALLKSLDQILSGSGSNMSLSYFGLIWFSILLKFDPLCSVSDQILVEFQIKNDKIIKISSYLIRIQINLIRSLLRVWIHVAEERVVKFLSWVSGSWDNSLHDYHPQNLLKNHWPMPWSMLCTL